MFSFSFMKLCILQFHEDQSGVTGPKFSRVGSYTIYRNVPVNIMVSLTLKWGKQGE